MIWYLVPCIPGLRYVTLSRSAVAIIALHVMPPSLAAAIRGSWDIFP